LGYTCEQMHIEFGRRNSFFLGGGGGGTGRIILKWIFGKKVVKMLHRLNWLGIVLSDGP
jgi:hypothetical protein